MDDSKKNHSQHDHIVFLGKAGFPIGVGDTQKMTHMPKALLRDGCKVTVICRKGVWKENAHRNFSRTGNFEGKDYIYQKPASDQ